MEWNSNTMREMAAADGLIVMCLKDRRLMVSDSRVTASTEGVSTLSEEAGQR